MRRWFRMAGVLSLFAFMVVTFVDAARRTEGWSTRDVVLAILTLAALWVTAQALVMVVSEAE